MFSPRICQRSCGVVGVLLTALGVGLPFAVSAATFSDLPDASSPVTQAVADLHARGIISGYADGTFRPDRPVNRAEALKILIAPLLKPEALPLLAATPFADIQPGAWYLPYVEAARQNAIIDGPPAKTAFLGSQPVKKMEFIKMLLLTYHVAPNSFSEIRLPLADDATDVDAWYYPYLRLAITSSMTMVNSQGLLEPGRELTRGETALLLYRFLMYQEGKRTQALLSETEMEIVVVLGALKERNIDQADFASARALLAARGANVGAPDQPVVQGALKIAEAFRAIVRAYHAGMGEQYDESVRLAGDAWNLAARAKEFSANLGSLSEQVQSLAKQIADSAREIKGMSSSSAP